VHFARWCTCTRVVVDRSVVVGALLATGAGGLAARHRAVRCPLPTPLSSASGCWLSRVIGHSPLQPTLTLQVPAQVSGWASPSRLSSLLAFRGRPSRRGGRGPHPPPPPPYWLAGSRTPHQPTSTPTTHPTSTSSVVVAEQIWRVISASAAGGRGRTFGASVMGTRGRSTHRVCVVCNAHCGNHSRTPA
jgi:hypothetical protein